MCCSSPKLVPKIFPLPNYKRKNCNESSVRSDATYQLPLSMTKLCETLEPENTPSLTPLTADFDGRSSRNDKRDWNERREAEREESEIMKQEKPGNDTQEKGACEVKSYASGRSVLDDHETDYVVRDENKTMNPSLMTDKSTEDWKCVQETGMVAFDREKQECVVASKDEPRENKMLNTSGWEDPAAANVSNSLHSPGKHLKFGDMESSNRCGGRGNQGLMKIEDGSWYVVDEVEEGGEEGEMGWGDDSSSQCQTWDEVDDTRALRELIMENEEKEMGACSSQKQFNMEGHRQDEIHTSFVQAGRRLSENHKMIQTVNRGCWNEEEVSISGVDTVRSDVSIQTSILIQPPVTAKTLVDHSTDCADLVAVTEATENTECRSDQCKKMLACCQSDLLKVTLEQREADAHLSHVTSKLKHVEEENRRLKDELSSVITDLIKQQQKPKTEEKTTATEINYDMVKMLQRSLSEAKQNLLHCNLKNIDLQAKLALQLISQAYEESEIIYSMKRLSISKKASLTMQMMKYQGQLQSCKETVDGWKIKSERMLASGGSIHNLPLLPPIDIEKFTPKFKPSVHGPLRHPTQPSAANIKLAANFSSSVQTDRTSKPQQVEKEKKEKMSQHASFILSAGSEDSKIPLCSTFMPNSNSDRPGSEFQPDLTASRFVDENNGCHLAKVETKNITEEAKNQGTAAPKKVENQLRTDPVVTPHQEPRTAFHSDSSLLYQHDPAMSLYHHPTASTKHGSTWQNSYLGQEVPPHRHLPNTSTSVEVPSVQPSNNWHTGELFYDKNNSYYSCQHKQPDNRIGTSDWMGQPIDLRSCNTQRLPGNIRVDTQHFTPKPLPENIQGELMAVEATIIQGVCSEQTNSPTSSSNMECMPNVHYIGSDRGTVNAPTQVQRKSPTNPTLPVTAMQTTVPADSKEPCDTSLSTEASGECVGTKVNCPSSTQKGESLQKYVTQDTRQEIDNIQIGGEVVCPSLTEIPQVAQAKIPRIRGEIVCPSLTEIPQVTQAKIPRQDLGPTAAEKDNYRNLDRKVGPPISPALQNIARKKEIVVHPNHIQKVARASVHSNVGLDTFEKEVTRAERKKRGKSTLTGTTDRGSGWLTSGGKRKKKQNERDSLRDRGEVVATTRPPKRDRGEVVATTRPPIEDDVIPSVFSLTHLLKKLSDMFPEESRLSLTSAILKVRANHRGQLDKVPYAIIISEATVILTSQNDTRQERSKGVACKLNARQDHQEAEEEPRTAPKGNLLPKLLKKMSETFPQKKKKDIIDGIIQVRKTHGGTLAGISMTQVIFEVSMFLKNIGTVQENDDKDLQDRNCCKICQGSIKSSQLVRELECLHTFHDECIQLWFQKREYRCPVCRRHALLQEDFPRLN
ncbi:uncharacterized protein [Apostichopus japonicus]|uniref:uncharacterized protein isoform X2 n=1 Tax=Stichopus japonicus TaxID=307972 RepID=UPI003AB5022A